MVPKVRQSFRFRLICVTCLVIFCVNFVSSTSIENSTNEDHQSSSRESKGNSRSHFQDKTFNDAFLCNVIYVFISFKI